MLDLPDVSHQISDLSINRRMFWSLILNTVLPQSLHPSCTYALPPSLTYLLSFTVSGEELRWVSQVRNFLVSTIKRKECGLQILLQSCFLILAQGLTLLISLAQFYFLLLKQKISGSLISNTDSAASNSSPNQLPCSDISSKLHALSPHLSFVCWERFSCHSYQRQRATLQNLD